MARSTGKPPVFQNLKAWFSSSVPRQVKGSWKNEGGKEVSSIIEANFIFTKDASCVDIEKIFKGEEFLAGLLAVFHVDYIDACLNERTPHEVAAAKYIVLPPDISDDVTSYVFKKSSMDRKSSHSSQTAGKDGFKNIQQDQRESDHSHTCTQNGNFVGGLEVQASDVDFSIADLDLESIPHVNSLPRAQGRMQDFYPGVDGFTVSLKG